MQNDVNGDYVTRIFVNMNAISAQTWDTLLAHQAQPTPFMRHAYLNAMCSSGSATTQTGWTLRLITLWREDKLAAACPVWLKTHSRGEYVFDSPWADAYERHGLSYYPKAVVASPFTPVPGTRLLASSAHARQALVQALLNWCQTQAIPSLHILFADAVDLHACENANMMRRQQVQFHWQNRGWSDFEAFLTDLHQDKRKKIRQERRKVREAGVSFRVLPGHQASDSDWAFVRHCYEQTYWEHGHRPYLQANFFETMQRHMPENWLIFLGQRAGQTIAMSLLGLQGAAKGSPEVAYGRYWGALERVDCLHFEACYYQPIEWCIAHGVQRFEGGAQGEHKMARALLPTATASAHWIAHPGFAQAIRHFLTREQQALTNDMQVLRAHTPMRCP